MADGDRPRPRLSRRREWDAVAGRTSEAAPEEPDAADPGRPAREGRDGAAGRQQRRGPGHDGGGADGDGRAGG